LSVNILVSNLYKDIIDILHEQFLGFYIQGSLALHDFVPERSDIDLVAITKKILSDDMLTKLKRMHIIILKNKVSFGDRTECVYIPQASLKNYVPEKAFFPCFHVGGSFYVDGFGLIEKHILRENGIVIKGPDPKSFIKPVSADELKKAAFDALQYWWTTQLIDHSKLIADDYQVYAVLSMCRAFYTILNGAIVSKSKAAYFAEQEVDKKWIRLVNKALSWKIGDRFNEMQNTIDFIKYTAMKLKVKEC
jgi:hypothetical protein